MAYKYPYIADKRMYAAVMGACSYIRETGYFNKAVRYYADKYNVDEDEVAQEIRKRQSAGQKGKKPASKSRKYKYFIVVKSVGGWGEEYRVSEPQILKGLNKSTVLRRFNYEDSQLQGDDYDIIYSHWAIAEFDTKTEAEKAFPDWKHYASSYAKELKKENESNLYKSLYRRKKTDK